MVPLAGKDIPICLWQTGPFHLRFTPIPNQSWFTSDSKCGAQDGFNRNAT